jgi:hypothetical protein
VPAHEPLGITHHLAGSRSAAKRHLAAVTLGYIAGQSGHRHLVEKQVDGWLTSHSTFRLWTAAILYGSRYGRENLTQALARLGRIARTRSLLVGHGVMVAVVQLLTHAEHRDDVLARLLSWCRTHDRTGGAENVRVVGFATALHACGLVPERDRGPLDPRPLAEEYPGLVRELALLALRDREAGQLGIDWLDELRQRVEVDKLATGPKVAEQRAELVRLARLVAPDLRWWRRRKVVASLSRKHPSRRRSIRRVFRVAARAQKRSETTL